MDQITFHRDTVLSDVHLLQPNARHLMMRLNRVGQPVFVSRFKILWEGMKPDSSSDVKETVDSDEDEEEEEKEEGRGDARDREVGAQGAVDLQLDEDGDLDVVRRPSPRLPDCRDKVHPTILSQSAITSQQEGEEENEDEVCLKDMIRIEHTMATPLEDVGKQVWRGAFLLADFVLSQPTTFRGATVLELGAGTGLTSIIMATVAKTVYCTDVGDDLLSMCQRNVTLNRHLLEPAGGEVKVRQLDWLQHSLCTDAEEEFSWTEEDVADLHDNTSFIMAADVCYDDELTDGLFRTLYRLCGQFQQPCNTYLSMEKRMNFTLRHMDVSCDAYDHFRHCLSQMQTMVDGRTLFQVEQVLTTFPQCLHYERTEQLELWKVTAKPAELN